MSTAPSRPGAPPFKRVAILDDHTMMRGGMKVFIDSLPDFECCWEAGDCKTAMQKIEADMPDILLVDITLPDRNGLEFIKDVHSIHPDLAMLVVSMHDEAYYAHRALKAGAKGYMMKNMSHDLYETALRRVAAGGSWLSDRMSEEILQAYTSGTKPRMEGGLDALTDREFEIFQMIGDGRGTHEIADALRISPKTVDVHRMNIRTKLKLEDGAAVTRFAIRWVESHKLGRS
ncbi:MAG: response regulator transcription factor [Prosthecobacter sp.]|jgi:DNA-binding NarL/FixJ family response regulator|uniref:response regulator n=1 Tax=Prosthecobacter sp. TaxID=1965333 RepID=UPI0019F80C93|nr:response regulator transcription factor [Prosthecobacter sp.]MBE2284106.1 response regulator transcription factor [Prosthecobacter sp.]